MMARLRQPMAREDGFTIIEALVAAIILTLGSLVVAVTFVTAIHSAQRSSESQYGISIAQREMEWVRAHDFTQIANKTAPEPAPSAADQLSPLDRVLPGQAGFSVNRAEDLANTTDFENAMPFVAGISGGFDTTKEVKYYEGSGERSEQAQAEVYRFVLCEEEEVLPEKCDTKRIVIDVVPKVNGIEKGRQRNYYELQSTVVNSNLRGRTET
jgi:type II secretory pathway pseudopilin PulG